MRKVRAFRIVRMDIQTFAAFKPLFGMLGRDEPGRSRPISGTMNRMTRSPLLAGPALAALLVAAGPQAAVAAPSTVQSEYAVSLYGLTLAKSSFRSTITSSGYELDGTLRSAGLASVFDDTVGTVRVSGRFGAEMPRPDAYTVDYVSGKKKKNTRITFAGGNVVSAQNTPPVRTNRPGWIPIASGHLANVADPLSATLVPAGSPDEVCRRTIRIFDGAMRADLRLAPAGRGEISIPGYEGATVRCTASFVPVSGFQQGKDSIKYLRDRARMTVAFAPVGATGVYAPVEASVSTQIGTVKVRALRFEAIE